MAERYIAFLRAINVGGRVVKMDRLRELLESIPLAKVETFIASGNVVFETRATNTRALEQRIEKQLHEALGYEVDTYVRSSTELARIADHEPFDAVAPGHSLLIGFLAAAPSAAACAAVAALPTDVDEFSFKGREIYWWCRTRLNETQVSGPRLAKALGMQTTFRNVTTIRRLVAKYPPLHP